MPKKVGSPRKAKGNVSPKKRFKNGSPSPSSPVNAIVDNPVEEFPLSSPTSPSANGSNGSKVVDGSSSATKGAHRDAEHDHVPAPSHSSHAFISTQSSIAPPRLFQTRTFGSSFGVQSMPLVWPSSVGEQQSQAFQDYMGMIRSSQPSFARTMNSNRANGNCVVCPIVPIQSTNSSTTTTVSSSSTTTTSIFPVSSMLPSSWKEGEGGGEGEKEREAAHPPETVSPTEATATATATTTGGGGCGGVEVNDVAHDTLVDTEASNINNRGDGGISNSNSNSNKQKHVMLDVISSPIDALRGDSLISRHLMRKRVSLLRSWKIPFRQETVNCPRSLLSSVRPNQPSLRNATKKQDKDRGHLSGNKQGLRVDVGKNQASLSLSPTTSTTINSAASRDSEGDSWIENIIADCRWVYEHHNTTGLHHHDSVRRDDIVVEPFLASQLDAVKATSLFASSFDNSRDGQRAETYAGSGGVSLPSLIPANTPEVSGPMTVQELLKYRIECLRVLEYGYIQEAKSLMKRFPEPD